MKKIGLCVSDVHHAVQQDLELDRDFMSWPVQVIF